VIVKLIREGLGRLIVGIDWMTRPKPIKRSEAQQQRVNQEAAGLALYQFYACPFCIRARRAIHRLAVPIELRDVQHDPRHRNDLQTLGGRVQVPCLRIEADSGVTWMYESADIIGYLERRFGSSATEAG
jgi:glutaredoxin